MNVTESIKSLRRMGWSVYKTYDNTNPWIVYDKTEYNGRYSNRKLIKLAVSVKNNHWKPSLYTKNQVGIGGKNCPCCTRTPPSKMKRTEHRAARRNEKQQIKLEL